MHLCPSVVRNGSRVACGRDELRYFVGMKFFLAMLAHVVICVVLGWGILLTVKGEPWVLIAGFLAYLVAFVRIGCLPQKTH